ncbi:MAG: cytoplasmic protein [Thermodesulfobacteriota bacterium]|nr:cytoplasmic protein [Thermodesulfobacteriota bacterium]
MARHSHRFVEEYTGLVGFGLDRETDEAALTFYLQKFSDDELLEALCPRLTGQQMNELFHLLSSLLREHFNDEEYHKFFLKEDHEI